MKITPILEKINPNNSKWIFTGTFTPNKRNKPRNYGLTKQASLSSEPQYRKPMPYLDAPYFPCYIGGLHLFKLWAVGWWITWLILCLEQDNLRQCLAYSQNDNYFHSKWSKVVILSETSHFVNLLSFDSRYFLLSFK